MAKRWKKEEITYLKRYAAKRRLEELSQRFRTDFDTVRKKLDELELEAADYKRQELGPDPGLAILEQALKALHAGKWQQAEKFLVRTVEHAERPELANRARRYLAVARERQAEVANQATDPFLEAVYERNRGNFERVLELCSRGGRQSKDERFAHLAASVHAAKGDLEQAAKFLELAIQLNPKNRVHAYHDSDFDELRENPEFAHLFDSG